MEIILSKHWHRVRAEETATLLGTDVEQGLDVFEVERRQERFGPNAITREKRPSSLALIAEQLNQPVVYILLAAGFVTAFMDEWIDAGVIFAVVFVNTLIGYLQESRAIRTIMSLEKELTSSAAVIRSGRKQTVASRELVPGDIVELKSGDRVPADMRIAEAAELHVDESALTGESLPVVKTVGILEEDTILSDRTNMAYGSTLVTYGRGIGVVTATGDKTEIGRISEMIATAKAPKTPLQRKIGDFSRILVWAILALAVATKLVGYYKGISWIESFKAAVALAVGAIPEGLPAAVTIILAIGVSRMAHRKALIRKLPAVEALGGVTVICSDKTGTLTQNQMTVQRAFTGGDQYAFSGVGYDPQGEVTTESGSTTSGESRALRECLKAGALCNDSVIKKTAEGYSVEGDPTEGALLVSAIKAGLSPDDLPQSNPRLDQIPFESERQYMATLHEVEGSSDRIIYVKGSVERIVSACATYLDHRGNQAPLNAEEVMISAEETATAGLRVLAFASMKVSDDVTSIPFRNLPDNMVFLGFQGMIDPPREEAVTAVQKCRNAGIRVKMITGDHPLTARAIAKRLGLGRNHDRPDAIPEILTGAAMRKLPNEDFIDKASDVDVFARVTPDQKLELVHALQSSGAVVAMTGDGVNDAPALKRADIGVAMGLGGTEVARQSADMVLTDDNFASIQFAVEEGRSVFDNLTKFIVWTLPTNVGEGLAILLAILIGEILPILPVQILWINMSTAILLGLMLAFEPKEPGIMDSPPRDPQQPILTRDLTIRIVIVGLLLVAGSFSLFEWELHSGASEAEARTSAVNMFVFGELFYLFNCRSLTRTLKDIGYFSNHWLIVGVIAMALAQIAFTYLPVMNRMFHSAPIPLSAWLYILAASALIFFVVAARERYLRARSARKSLAGQ